MTHQIEVTQQAGTQPTAALPQARTAEPPSSLSPRVSNWLARRSSRATDWTAEQLLAMKGTTTISVVIPARNEEATVGDIVGTLRAQLVEHVALLDEVLVVDSRSDDTTAEVARAAGASVVAEQDVLPELPPMRGKGEALWKGVAASRGDIVVFVDGDLHDFTADYVTGLLGPLLSDPAVAYVKGFYHRPLVNGSSVQEDGGGRVTELVARPLLNMHWPELAGFVQPLAGEYAGRRGVLEKIPFVAHYGVEIGHLIDLVELVGLDALAQVDLGHRKHRHQTLHGLGQMAGQIMLTVHDRLERYGRVVTADQPATTLTQFRRSPAGSAQPGVDRDVVVTSLSADHRPPLASLRARRR